MRFIIYRNALILTFFLASLCGKSYAQGSFDTSLCYKIVELGSGEKYLLRRLAVGAGEFNSVDSTGYVLNGEIQRVWQKKSGIFHFGNTKTRAQNVIGAFHFGVHAHDLFSASTELRSFAGKSGAKICLCWGNNEEDFSELKILKNNEANSTVQSPHTEYSQALKKSWACEAAVKSLLPAPSVEPIGKTYCPRYNMEGQCSDEF